MRYEVTQIDDPVLKEVVHLVGDTRHWLGLLSSAATAEWDRLRDRFPTAEDVHQGFISLSGSELREVRATLWRFREMVNAKRLALAPGVFATSGSHPMTFGRQDAQLTGATAAHAA